MDSGNLLERLVCVRLVDYVGKDGKLKALNTSTEKRPKDEFSSKYVLDTINPNHRLTVHFSLNYCYRTYTPAALGKRKTFRWDNKKHGVLIPLKSLIESSQIPVNLLDADTFFLREVSLTDDSRVVSGSNIVERVKDEMHDMGFEYIEGTMFGWRPKYKEEKGELSKLAKELGITSARHYKTVFGIYESTVSIVENWRGAIDWWFSDDPKALEYYHGLGRELNEAHDKLVGILESLPDKGMKRNALKALRNAESNYVFDNPLFHKIKQ